MAKPLFDIVAKPEEALGLINVERVYIPVEFPAEVEVKPDEMTSVPIVVT